MEFDSKHGGLPPMNSADAPKRTRTWLYMGIIAFLVLTNIVVIYFFINNKNNSQNNTTADNSNSNFNLEENTNTEINAHYNTALAKLDQLSMQNTTLGQQLNDKNSEISILKDSIETILKDKNSSIEDLRRAQGLINNLEGKINYYTAEISKYKKENKKLVKEKSIIEEQNEHLERENEILTKKIEVAQVFSVNNIKFLPIELRKGGSEVETTKARSVDILRIKFDINENNLIEPGTHTFYMRIIDPNGSLIFNTGSGSGTFSIEGIDLEQKYTKSRKIHFSNSDPINNLTIDWEQSNDYPKGQYIIELYHQGVLIGKSIRQLR